MLNISVCFSIYLQVPYILLFTAVIVALIEWSIAEVMAECSAIPILDNRQLLVKTCHPWTWRIANVFMAVFFSLAAYVQVSFNGSYIQEFYPDYVNWSVFFSHLLHASTR